MAVVPLRPIAATPDLAALVEMVASLRAELLATNERLAVVESRLPPPRFEFPPNFVTIKQASAICGFKPPTIYAWYRGGRIIGAKDGGSVRVDPASLPIKSLLALSRDRAQLPDHAQTSDAPHTASLDRQS
jgi:Helix-turn-helix domain